MWQKKCGQVLIHEDQLERKDEEICILKLQLTSLQSTLSHDALNGSGSPTEDSPSIMFSSFDMSTRGLPHSRVQSTQAGKTGENANITWDE